MMGMSSGDLIDLYLIRGSELSEFSRVYISSVAPSSASSVGSISHPWLRSQRVQSRLYLIRGLGLDSSVSSISHPSLRAQRFQLSMSSLIKLFTNCSPALAMQDWTEIMTFIIFIDRERKKDQYWERLLMWSSSDVVQRPVGWSSSTAGHGRSRRLINKGCTRLANHPSQASSCITNHEIYPIISQTRLV